MDIVNRKRLRILFVHTRYLQSAGGEDTTMEAEAELMRAKGHNVQVQLFNNGSMGKGLAGKISAGISSVYNRNSAHALKEAIVQFSPDIIHVHNFFFAASPSVIIEASRHKIPVIVTIQNFRLVCANALFFRDNKICELCISHSFPWYGVKYKCYHNSSVQSAMVGLSSAIHHIAGTWKRKVNLFITPAEFSRNKLLDSALGIRPEKIKVKRNFIGDPGESNPSDRKSFYLFVGRLSAEKGVDLLLEAWKRIGNEQLIIAGDGPEKEYLYNKYGKQRNIIFAGKKPRVEILELMKQCRALIFPSVWYEGLPLTIVEAFATGTPVLASSLGAMQEMITHGSNGLLFPAGDSEKLAETVNSFNRIIASGDLSMYQNARSAYMNNYHPEQCYQQIMKLYNSVIPSSKNNE